MTLLISTPEPTPEPTQTFVVLPYPLPGVDGYTFECPSETHVQPREDDNWDDVPALDADLVNYCGTLPTMPSPDTDWTNHPLPITTPDVLPVYQPQPPALVETTTSTEPAPTYDGPQLAATGTPDGFAIFALIISTVAVTLAVVGVVLNMVAASMRRSWHNDVDEPTRHAAPRNRAGRRAR